VFSRSGLQKQERAEHLPAEMTYVTTRSIVFATSDSILHRWLASLLQPQVGGSKAEVALLDTIVPGRAIQPEIMTVLASAKTMYIVERADEKRFVPRNPLGGYDVRLRAFSTLAFGGEVRHHGGRGQLRHIEVLLVNGTCNGWCSLLDAAGWAIAS
jgi:hypothetical protein